MTGAASGARRFWVILGVIVAIALGVRLVYVAKVAVHDHAFYDAAYYHLQANKNAEGGWYQNPFPFHPAPAADHAPLTALVLTPVAWAIPSPGDNLEAMRYTMAVLGAGVVLVVGLLGRKVGGDAVGWVAAAVAAVYPLLLVNDGLVMAETPAAGLTAGAVLLAYRLRRTSRFGAAAALGVVCGLAALARVELVLLVLLLALPAALLPRADRWSRRVGLAAVATGAAALVIVPWIGWNLARFEQPTLFSTNDGGTMLGAACDEVFSGPNIGGWSFACYPPPPPGDPSEQNATYRTEALDYLRAHLRRYPVVVAARLGRMWSVYRPFDSISQGRSEGRARWVSALGLGFYYPVAVLAIVGAVVLQRRRSAWWPLMVPLVIVTLEVIPAYGLVRLRVPAEPSLVVLASVALVALVQRVRGAATRPVAEVPA